MLSLSQPQENREKKSTSVIRTCIYHHEAGCPKGKDPLAHPCPQTLQQKLRLEGAKLLCVWPGTGLDLGLGHGSLVESSTYQKNFYLFFFFSKIDLTVKK